MSQRTIVEFNHDYAHDVGEEPKIAEMLQRAMSSGSKECWQQLERYGIRRVVQLHHSDERKVVTKHAEYQIG